MKSVENLKQRLVDGEITDQELWCLRKWYTQRSRMMFWEIRDLMIRGLWDRAEELQKELNEFDKEEADLYGFIVYFLEFKNGE